MVPGDGSGAVGEEGQLLQAVPTGPLGAGLGWAGSARTEYGAGEAAVAMLRWGGRETAGVGGGPELGFGLLNWRH